MLVWYDVAERNVEFLHELRRQPGGALDSCRAGVAGIFTHFDPDRFLVSRSLVIGMLSLFIERQGLADGIGVHRVVPGEVTQGIVGGL